jgi:hypothetical protein
MNDETGSVLVTFRAPRQLAAAAEAAAAREGLSRAALAPQLTAAIIRYRR